MLNDTHISLILHFFQQFPHNANVLFVLVDNFTHPYFEICLLCYICHDVKIELSVIYAYLLYMQINDARVTFMLTVVVPSSLPFNDAIHECIFMNNIFMRE